jgi:copper(I)-binding protein
MRALLLGCCLLIFACSSEPRPPLVATDLEITATMPGGEMSAGYLSLRNNSDDAIGITRVTSPEFEAVEIHTSFIEDGISKMRRSGELIIAPGNSVTLQRGGMHLMLMRPTGASNDLSLSFYDEKTLLLTVHTSITPRDN